MNEINDSIVNILNSVSRKEKLTQKCLNNYEPAKKFTIMFKKNTNFLESDKNFLSNNKTSFSNVLDYNLNDLNMLELLGEGHSSKVFKAFNRKTNQFLVVKFYLLDYPLTNIHKEAEILNAVEKINKKKRFLSYYGLYKYFIENDKNYIYFMIMELGIISLADVFFKIKEYSLTQILYIFESLTTDFLYLQENRIAQRDLKPHNIILVKSESDATKFYYKISDFGMGQLLNKKKNASLIHEIKGFTEFYVSPEIKLFSKADYTSNESYDPFKSDVYSLGILILELMNLVKEIFFESYDKNNKLHLLLINMLENNPEDRIDFKEVKKQLDLIIKDQGLLLEQHKDENLIIVEKFENEKLINNNININYYLNSFNAYCQLKLFKFAEEKIEYCYNELYLKNKDENQNKSTEANIFFNFAIFHEFFKKDINIAEEYYVKCLRIRENTLGYYHFETFESYNNLIMFYERNNDNEKAEKIYKQFLIICKNSFKKNIQIAEFYKNFANFNQKVKKNYENLKKYCEKSLNIYNKILGDNNLESANIYNKLANYYKNIKYNYSKAEEYYIKCVQINEMHLGLDNINTAISYNNMALFYNENNTSKFNSSKAIEFFLKSVKTHERVLGPEHSDTATVYSNLASNYLNTMNYDKAQELYSKSLAIREKVLGINHLLTARSYNNLGYIYQNIRQDYKKAEEFYLLSLKIRESVLGKHPDTAQSYNNLGYFYQNIEQDYKKAEELYRKSLKIRKSVLGKHTDTAQSYNNLGAFYQDVKQDFKKAEKYYLKSLKINESILGIDHLNTAYIYNNLGFFYYKVQQDYIKSEDFFFKSLKIIENIVGFEHTDTSKLYNNLGVFYQDVKHDYIKAEEFFLKSLKIREKYFGMGHSFTATSYNNLGFFYQNIKQDYNKAEEYYIKSLKIKENILGFEHSDTAISYNNLGVFYQNVKQDYIKSKEFFLKSVKIREKVFGLFHSETIQSSKNLEVLFQSYKQEFPTEEGE